MNEMEDQYMADDESEEQSQNERELIELTHEIDRIMVEGLSPSESWYRKRYHHIEIYSELGWSGFAQRFERIDRFIHNTSLNIMNNIEDLMEEYDQKGHYDLRNYQHLLHDIHELWNYFKTVYIGQESNSEVIDIMIGLSQMMTNL